MKRNTSLHHHFSDHEHLNRLVAMLDAWDVHNTVVCPGARNAPIINDIVAANYSQVYRHTDERCAAFMALGVSLRSDLKPVAVVVTSGTALLNTLPAVAEARERHIPLVIISADRPKESLGQLEGQTLPQRGALMPYARTFQLREHLTSEQDRWYFDHTLNEAFAELTARGGGPVHLNVPISEPLFAFSEKPRPEVVSVQTHRPEPAPLHLFTEEMLELLHGPAIPILLIGQLDSGQSEAVKAIEESGSMLVIPDFLSGQEESWRTQWFETHPLPSDDMVVVHIGGNTVGKKLRERLRGVKNLTVIRIEPGEAIPDTFRALRYVVHAPVETALEALRLNMFPRKDVIALKEIVSEMHEEEEFLRRYEQKDDPDVPRNIFKDALEDFFGHAYDNSECVRAIHVSNSTPLRLAQQIFPSNHGFLLHCNRGTNGIEGTLSAAVGYALAEEQYTHHYIEERRLTLCITGDLSFFYDCNALWNEELEGSLRVLLLNDGGGSIFHRLPGLSESRALTPFVDGTHRATAEGICRSYRALYLSFEPIYEASTLGKGQKTAVSSVITNFNELYRLTEQLITMPSSRPVVLEVKI